MLILNLEAGGTQSIDKWGEFVTLTLSGLLCISILYIVVSLFPDKIRAGLSSPRRQQLPLCHLLVLVDVLEETTCNEQRMH